MSNVCNIPHGLRGGKKLEYERLQKEMLAKIENREFGGLVPRCDGLGFPDKYKIEPKYMLVNPQMFGGLSDGVTLAIAPILMDEVDGVTRHLRFATNALGDSQWKMDAEYHPNGNVLYQDVSHGPGYRLAVEANKFRSFGTGDPATTPCIGAPSVMRYYFDENGHAMAQLKLNDVLRPVGSELDMVLVVFQDGPGDMDKRPKESWGWGDTGDGKDRWVHVVYEDGTGRMLHMEKDDGCVQFYSGPEGSEALRLATHDPRKSRLCKGDGTYCGVVSEAYKGPKGRAYLTRRTYADGTTAYHGGTTPQRTPLRREVLPNGRIRYYDGPKWREKLVRETFHPRDDGSTEDVSAPDLVFAVGDAVRPCGLRRTDLNNCAGVVIEYKSDTGRFAVRLGSRGRDTYNIKPENLLTESQFQENREARNANRTAAQRERNDHRTAERLARQQAREETARAAVALATAEAAPVPPTVAILATPTAPLATRQPTRNAVCCPISGEPMLDAVLASDGYVYSEKALQDFWQQCGFESPITSAKCTAVVLPHIWIRAVARDMADTPRDPQWRAVPTEEPDFVCCPITQEVMTDPVRASDGNVYDRASLTRWFATGKQTSPLTNEDMAVEMCKDLTMRQLCQAWQ